MTVSRYRQHRGSETQTAVARWFAGHGWPFAAPVGAGRGGTDVTGMPGLLVEVKARRDLNLTEWLRQHAKPTPQSSLRGGVSGPCETGVHAGCYAPAACECACHIRAFVVHRPDGYGPARVAEWPVTMRLDDFTSLLHEAGYGTKED